jgi:uncharacterized damage-inducible protein DinB
MSSAVESFRRTYGHTRSLTFDFIQAIPDESWEFSPHPRFAPFHKQVRHLVCVQGVYIGGLRDRVTDFGKKHEHYAGPLDRANLVAALREKDAELNVALDAIAPEDEDGHVIEFYGQNPLASYLNVINHHEALHQGQWSLYAALGGFETPQSWKLNWGL